MQSICINPVVWRILIADEAPRGTSIRAGDMM